MALLLGSFKQEHHCFLSVLNGRFALLIFPEVLWRKGFNEATLYRLLHGIVSYTLLRGTKSRVGYIQKGLPWWLSGKESTCQRRRHKRHGFDPWMGKIP